MADVVLQQAADGAFDVTVDLRREAGDVREYPGGVTIQHEATRAGSAVPGVNFDSPAGTLRFTAAPGVAVERKTFPATVLNAPGILRAPVEAAFRIFDPDVPGAPPGTRPPVIGRSVARAKILPYPSFALEGAPAVLAPAAGGTDRLVFRVRKPAASKRRSPSVMVRDSGRGTATAGTDYEPFADLRLDFGDGADVQDVEVVVRHNPGRSGDLTVILELFGAVEGDVDPEGMEATGTIYAEPVFRFGPRRAVIEPPEGERGVLDFTIHLTPASRELASVVVSDSGTGTAVAGVNYEAVHQTTLTFQPGETSQPFPVVVLNDNKYEPEGLTVVLRMTNPMGARIGGG